MHVHRRRYAVPFTQFHDAAGDPAEALAGVPRSWDWVVENHRACKDSHKEMHGFRAFFHAAREHFSTRHPVGVAGRDPPAYEPHQDLRVELPADACAAAAATTGGRQAIAVVLAGSSVARHLYPSAASWELILGALSPELLHATEILIDKRLSYHDALAAYFPRLLAAYDGDRTRAFSFDDIGELYLPTTD